MTHILDAYKSGFSAVITGLSVMAGALTALLIFAVLGFFFSNIIRKPK